MLMYAFLSKAMVPLAALGLLAASELPPGWLQLGVAGASLCVLMLFITRTHPRIIKEIMDGHAAATNQMCNRLDTLIRDVCELKEDKP